MAATACVRAAAAAVGLMPPGSRWSGVRERGVVLKGIFSPEGGGSLPADPPPKAEECVMVTLGEINRPPPAPPTPSMRSPKLGVFKSPLVKFLCAILAPLVTVIRSGPLVLLLEWPPPWLSCSPAFFLWQSTQYKRNLEMASLQMNEKALFRHISMFTVVVGLTEGNFGTMNSKSIARWL